jgi:hypothetical protein
MIFKDKITEIEKGCKEEYKDTFYCAGTEEYEEEEIICGNNEHDNLLCYVCQAKLDTLKECENEFDKFIENLKTNIIKNFEENRDRWKSWGECYVSTLVLIDKLSLKKEVKQ